MALYNLLEPVLHSHSKTHRLAELDAESFAVHDKTRGVRIQVLTLPDILASYKYSGNEAQTNTHRSERTLPRTQESTMLPAKLQTTSIKEYKGQTKFLTVPQTFVVSLFRHSKIMLTQIVIQENKSWGDKHNKSERKRDQIDSGNWVN